MKILKKLIDKARTVKLLGYTVAQYAMFTLFCSFFGFLAENLGKTIIQGIFDSRFMILPFIMPYGLGILAAYLVLGRPSEFRIFGYHFIKGDGKKVKNLRRLLYYIVAFAAITFGEMGYGLLVEATTGKQLWDYSHIPTHITQYTSIITSFLFTTGVYVVMEYIMPAIMRFFEKISSVPVVIIALLLFCLSVADMLFMMIRLFVNGAAKCWWRIEFPWGSKDLVLG